MKYKNSYRDLAVSEGLWAIERFGEKLASDPGVKKASNILITGYPGAGKTTLSKRFGAETGKPIVHLDDVLKEEVTKDQWAGKSEVSLQTKKNILNRLKKIEDLIIEGTLLLHNKYSPTNNPIGKELKGERFVLNTPRDVAVERKAQ